jgi:RsiW-degrading membrane proteinase PrsW (M82 family)
MGGTLFLVCAFVVLLRNGLLPLSTLAQNGSPTILTTLSIPILSALSIYLLVNFIDRFKQGAWFVRLAAFIWGAIIAIPPTQFVEQYIDSLRFVILGSDHNNIVHPIFTSLNAGITEETAKGLGLLLLFIMFRNKFTTTTSGIVYGALIGAGFAMVENFSYFVSYPKSLLFLFLGRVVLGWLNHSTFTVCFGAALGSIKHTKVRWQCIVIPLSGYLGAIGLHSAFDFVNSFASSLVSNDPTSVNTLSFSLLASVSSYIPPFLAQVLILYFLLKSLTHEMTVIRTYLVSEVKAGVVTIDEYVLITHPFLRMKVERRMFFRYGLKQWIRVKRLHQTEIELAFHKWHMSTSEKPKPDLKRRVVVYRQRIKYLRKEIMEEEIAYETKQ